MENYGQSILIEHGEHHSDHEFSIIKEKLISFEKIWNFDEFGHLVPVAKADELYFDYFAVDKNYIQIQKFQVNQDNLLPIDVYMFLIFKYGYTDRRASLTNNLAYADIRDCLDSALYFIDKYHDLIEDYFAEDGMNTTITDEGLSGEIFSTDGIILN